MKKLSSNHVAAKGKILRLKVGYNPNSSSMGSVVYLFSTKLLLFTASFGLVAGMILSHFGRKKKDSDKKQVKNTQKNSR